jgi:hypothetical protein
VAARCTQPTRSRRNSRDGAGAPEPVRVVRRESPDRMPAEDAGRSLSSSGGGQSRGPSRDNAEILRTDRRSVRSAAPANKSGQKPLARWSRRGDGDVNRRLSFAAAPAVATKDWSRRAVPGGVEKRHA